MAVYGRREKTPVCVYPFGGFWWTITHCQHADTTNNFSASLYVVMATTPISSPSCTWLPQHTLEMAIMR